ncbi:MAG: regulatory protein RecX [Bdellovibrionota bacterium]
MDLLARRNHSELELKQKLEGLFPADDIIDAIRNAQDNGWMPPAEEIAERVAIELGRKRKGHRFINQFLRNKGLPPVSKDADGEIEKARAIVFSKLRKEGPFDATERAKIYRLLTNRGFEDDTIRRVIGGASPAAD